MYSPNTIQKREFQIRKAGLRFKRRPREDSIEISNKLQRLRLDDRGNELPVGQLARPLDTEEQAFIESERILSKIDFEYYFTRYHAMELDPGVRDPVQFSTRNVIADADKIGPPILLESQRRYITLFGRREEEMYAEYAKYGFTEGIKAYVHKVRQVAATATIRGMDQHRRLFWSGTRSFVASLDEDRIGEIFKRDHLSIDRLPFWLKPARIYPDVKDTEMGFDPPFSSRISYQTENQETGIGTGSQNDSSHLTEVALFQYPSRIQFSFVPSIPKAITTLHVQESTSNGKGYWREVTEAARHKRRGYESWIYAFIPWYMNKLKYRSIVPDAWSPEEHTERHAELIERTSPEFYDGITYRPNREQLYWWETERAAHVANGQLAIFLTNYPATPEQSFQSRSQGWLPAELLEIMEQETRGAMPYEVDIAA